MKLLSTAVGMEECGNYRRPEIKDKVDAIFKSISFTVAAGSRVMLKPNLISAGNNGLPCTHPELIGAVAEWFVDHGAHVRIGDSPAFGSAEKVMHACGITAALQGLSVGTINFGKPRSVELVGGFRVGVESEVLESDVLVNLPKCKAHGQLFLSLAVKNLFGCVVGLRKPLIHARYGDVQNRFEELLVNLLDVLPSGVSLLDGIVAMHETGPMNGKPCRLGVLAASLNPVALDSAVLSHLRHDHSKSPLWNECKRRGLPGADLDALQYPLKKPGDISGQVFVAPDHLKPVTFHPGRLMTGAIKRMIAQVR